LFIGTRVEVPDLAGKFGGDDAVGGEEGICERGLSVVLGMRTNGKIHSGVTVCIEGTPQRDTYHVCKDADLDDC
jgi:hypothetical protein